MITLYTLPTCGICKMIKTKLEQKNILYTEKNFEDIAAVINSDRAPALETDSGAILNSPTSIVEWINKYGE